MDQLLLSGFSRLRVQPRNLLPAGMEITPYNHHCEDSFLPSVFGPQIKTTGSNRVFALIQSIQALFWLEWGSSNFTRAPPPAPALSQTHGNPGPGAVNDARCPILACSLRKGGIPRHVPFEILFHRASVL